jgi:hypothetical protein
MKKIYLLIVLSCFSWLSSLAKHVPAENARQVAANFLAQVAPVSTRIKGQSSLTLVHQEVAKQKSTNARQAPFTFYYVFAVPANGGMVFISADDNVSPVLGYTRTGTYNPAKLPTNLVKWLEGYKNEIRFAAKQGKASDKVKLTWRALQNGSSPVARTGGTLVESVDPLLTTTWDQATYYNALCPYDNNAGEQAVTGCVATSMA